MLTWVFISSVIAAFSAAALEFFREDTSSQPGQAAKLPLDQGQFWPEMTEADLDGLMREFLSDADQCSTLSVQQ